MPIVSGSGSGGGGGGPDPALPCVISSTHNTTFS